MAETDVILMLTAVHADTDSSIYEGVKDSNLHFIVISVILNILIIKK